MERRYNGRRKLKCPWCDYENSRFMKDHIEDVHNKNNQDYYLAINNLIEMPLCEICGKVKVTMQGSSLVNVNKTCGKKCHTDLISLNRNKNGTCSLSAKNRKNDENGKDLIIISADKTRIENGTHNFLKNNRPINVDGSDYYGSNNRIVQKKIANMGLHPFQNPKIDENGINLTFKKIYDKRVKNHSYSNLSKSRKSNGNKSSYVYVGLFTEDSILKIGMTDNVNFRKAFIESNSTIKFDKFYYISKNEVDAGNIENNLLTYFSNNTKVLDKIKYPNNHLGRTEWFDSKIFEELLDKLKEFNNGQELNSL